VGGEHGRKRGKEGRKTYVVTLHLAVRAVDPADLRVEVVGAPAFSSVLKTSVGVPGVLHRRKAVVDGPRVVSTITRESKSVVELRGEKRRGEERQNEEGKEDSTYWTR
jgi:hypothetical protein